jgi:type I restriction enzyme S subunit
MSKKTIKALVPQLRFPEFRDAGAWEEKPLNQIAKCCKQKNSQNKLKRVFTNSAEFGVLDQRDFFDKDIANQNNLVGYYIVDKGDYVYNPRISKTAPVGPISRNNIAIGIMSPLYTVFRFNNKNSDFFTHYFNSTCWHHYMRQASSTGARHDRMAITNVDFMALPVPVISVEEQQKIANCLSSIDDLISAQSQKVEELKSHKKGLMQQLFPGEGGTISRLRFPAFRGAGAWKTQRIEALAKRGSGHTPDKKEASYYNGGIKWVSLADSNKLDNGYLYSTKIEISMAGIKNSSAVLHPAGTVVLSRDAGVGKSAIIHSDMAVSQHFMAWICDKSKLSNWFLYYILQILKPTFERVAAGSTIKTIGLPYFKDLCITIPCVIEQQKIADCLSSIDELITAHTQKLEALKTHKKGLMQALFPAADEVEE